MKAQDYKHTSPRAPKPIAPQGSWVSFISGLGLGLLVALGVYLWSAKLPRPPAVVAGTVEPKVDTPKVAEQAPLETIEAEPETPRPKFDFYKILPEMEVPVQEWELSEKAAKASANAAAQANVAPSNPATPAVPATAATASAAPPVAASAETGAYILQIGSYKQFEEADRAKAKLALQGISASIQRVVINGQDAWFRVHVGPLSDLNELRAMRMKLMESNTDFIVLKIGGASTT